MKSKRKKAKPSHSLGVVDTKSSSDLLLSNGNVFRLDTKQCTHVSVSDSFKLFRAQDCVPENLLKREDKFTSKMGFIYSLIAFKLSALELETLPYTGCLAHLKGEWYCFKKKPSKTFAMQLFDLSIKRRKRFLSAFYGDPSKLIRDHSNVLSFLYLTSQSSLHWNVDSNSGRNLKLRKAKSLLWRLD